MKPIIFNTDMVRKILSGKKTVTRRPVKGIPDDCHRVEWIDEENVFEFHYGRSNENIFLDMGLDKKPPYFAGDILYVRETFGIYQENWQQADYCLYRADYTDEELKRGYCLNEMCESEKYDLPKWRPSIHMPKEAARLFLKVTDVYVEELDDITNEQAKKEGIEGAEGTFNFGSHYNPQNYDFSKEVYMTLWDSIYGKEFSCNKNPYVWVIEFEVVEKGE